MPTPAPAPAPCTHADLRGLQARVSAAKKVLQKQKAVGGRPRAEIEDLEAAVQMAEAEAATAREERIRVVERRLISLIEQGNGRRAVSATLLNAESSRSHALVTVRVEHTTSNARGGTSTSRVRAKMNMVDLAGSGARRFSLPNMAAAARRPRPSACARGTKWCARAPLAFQPPPVPCRSPSRPLAPTNIPPRRRALQNASPSRERLASK